MRASLFPFTAFEAWTILPPLVINELRLIPWLSRLLDIFGSFWEYRDTRHCCVPLKKSFNDLPLLAASS